MPNLISIDSSKEELLICVKKAVELFLEETPNLMDFEVHEQAISHRIALHLQQFTRLNVDCEYNKNLKGTKYLMAKEEVYKNCTCGACRRNPPEEGQKRRRFRPDIIVHKRGDESKNLIAVEVKKTDFCLFDKAKLMALTDETEDYHYKLGVFIYFPEGRAQYKCYADGGEWAPQI